MKTTRKKPGSAGAEKKSSSNLMSRETFSRRKFMTVSAAFGATILTGKMSAAAQEKSMKKTFTILHTNDMHSNFIGMGPASDYTPFTLNDDKTRGGYARLAVMLAPRRKARSGEGPVLTLDAGDYSMGTAFAAASRASASPAATCKCFSVLPEIVDFKSFTSLNELLQVTAQSAFH